MVQSLLPVEYPWITNDLVRGVNRTLADIAEEHGARYLDVCGAFTATSGAVLPGLLSDDGVHLSTKGYGVWALEVERFLNGRTAR